MKPSLGPWLLSGLMIGPVLGSGILLLPPLAVERAGDYAWLGWCLVVVLGALFARLFGKLAVRYPGDGGLVEAVDRAFGPRIRWLASQFLILAVCVGPVAVLVTAGEYLSVWIHGDSSYAPFYALSLAGVGLGILLHPVDWIGRVSLILSSTAAILLFAGSLASLSFYREGDWLATSFEGEHFGGTILLLFWAIVGWEIIGNYSLETQDRARTIPRALILSVTVVTAVTLFTAAAIQWVDPVKLGPAGASLPPLAALLYPLLGMGSLPVMVAVATGLCLSTYLLVMGAAARLLASRPSRFPAFSKRNAAGAPWVGIILLWSIHLMIFALLMAGWVNTARLVTIANTFFIGNALCGIAAAWRLLPGRLNRFSCLILFSGFFALLLFTPVWLWVVLLTLIVLAYRDKRLTRVSDHKENNDHPCSHPSAG